VILLFMLGLVFRAKARRQAEYAQQAEAQAAQAVEASRSPAFGPVLERVFEFANDSHRALNLASGNFVSSTPDRPLDFGPDGAGSLREAGVDLYLSDAALAAFSNRTTLDENDVPQLNALDFRTLENLVSDDGGEPPSDITDAEYGIVDLTNEQLVASDHQGQTLSGTKVLKVVTGEGARGLLQIDGFTDDPRGVKVRYKLLEQSSVTGASKHLTRESLTDRLEAAGAISSNEERSRAFARLATDAARIGEVELIKASLQGTVDTAMRDRAALDSARLLARGTLKRQAIEIAKTITNNEMRDLALSELAQ
jgi:hypothetical protein